MKTANIELAQRASEIANALYCGMERMPAADRARLCDSAAERLRVRVVECRKERRYGLAQQYVVAAHILTITAKCNRHGMTGAA